MSHALKQLLVHFDHSPGAVVRLNLARRIAAEQEASVTALHAVTPLLLDTPFAAEAGPAAIASLREVDEERFANAKRAFDAAMEETPGVRAHWAYSDGRPADQALVAQALCADLVVLGQRDPSGENRAGLPFDLIESTLTGSGKPALVVPFIARDLQPPREVAIAWKPTREAARAVAAAMPLLRKARTVHVMAWGELREAEGIQGARLDLDGWLRLHGVKPQWHREADAEPGTMGEMLLSRAFDFGADLLVMGCYGHSRAREWVLGGASRTVLQSMTLPVLMAH